MADPSLILGGSTTFLCQIPSPKSDTAFDTVLTFLSKKYQIKTKGQARNRAAKNSIIANKIDVIIRQSKLVKNILEPLDFI